MPTKLDSIGTYIGEILNSVVDTTKNGFPQWVVQLRIEQKYVEDAAELAHFKLAEPQYVDYSPFDYEDTGYFCLFNNDGELKSYEQAQVAVGWDGASFDTLPTVAQGKKVLIRADNNEYNGKTSIKIQWIDAADASPTRTLKGLDQNELKSLTAKFITKKPAVKPAKPTAAKPAVPTSSASPAAKPAAGAAKPTATAAPAAAKPATTTAAPAATQPAKKTKTAPPVSTPPSTAASSEPPLEALPAETDQMAAWEFVTTHKGDNGDDVIQDAWIAACSEVSGGTRADTDFTTADWAKVRDIVRKDCSLS